MVIPSTAHAAFDKAAAYFGIEPVRVPVGADMRADVAATADAITDRTVVVVGSAPSYPHGVIDPIEELGGAGRRPRRRLPHRRLPGRLRAAVGASGWAATCRRSTSPCPA